MRDPHFCAVSSYDEFDGRYMNSSAPPDRYLSEVLLPVLVKHEKPAHKDITAVAIEMLSNKSAKLSFLREETEILSEELGVRFKDKYSSVELYSKNGFLPSPSKGKTIGPKSTRIMMYKSCSGDLKIMKSDASYWLSKLVLPAGEVSQEYSMFASIDKE